MSEPVESPLPPVAPTQPAAAPAWPAAAAQPAPAGSAQPAASEAPQSPLPANHVVTGRRPSRGATGRGVVVLILVLSAAVGLLEVVIGGHRGHAFAIAFVVSSIAGALVVRRRDIPTAMIAPPLVYCVLIGLLSLVDTKDLTGGFATREAFYIANAFVTGAPTMWIATLAAVAIGWYRLRTASARPRGTQLPA